MAGAEGRVDLRAFVAHYLCGRAYNDDYDLAARGFSNPRKKKTYLENTGCEESYFKIVKEFEQRMRPKSHQKRIIFDALGVAAMGVMQQCVAETKFPAKNPSIPQRVRLIWCTREYVVGDRRFSFEGKQDIDLAGLLAYFLGRAKADYDLSADIVAPALSLFHYQATGGLFAKEAEELYRGAMASVPPNMRPEAALAVSASVVRHVRKFAADLKAAPDDAGREQVLRGVATTVAMGIDPDANCEVRFERLPAALSDPAQLGVKGTVTPELASEVRRLYMRAHAMLKIGAKDREARSELTQRFAEAIRARGIADPARLARELANLGVREARMKEEFKNQQPINRTRQGISRTKMEELVLDERSRQHEMESVDTSADADRNPLGEQLDEEGHYCGVAEE